jgi:hypothetical protein
MTGILTYSGNCGQVTSNIFYQVFFAQERDSAIRARATLASGKAVFAVYGLGEIHSINIQNLDLAVRTSKDRISMFSDLRYAPGRGFACAPGSIGEQGKSECRI